MRVLVADANDGRGMEAALALIFAQGIDLALQRSTPLFWQHYFNPALDWPSDPRDSLSGQPIYALNGLSGAAKDVTPPNLKHQVDLKMSPSALKDKVRGAIQLRLVVDADGIPRRIAVARPLGYGLDERAIEAATHWRFSPAVREGQPVASAVLLNVDVQSDTAPR